MARTKQPVTEFGNRYRTGDQAAEIRQAILDHLHFTQARRTELATPNDWYMAVAYAVRDRMLEDWLQSLRHLNRKEVKVVSYLSAEFLMGPHLGNNLVNLGILEPFRQAVAELGLDLDELLRQEEEPGLGNGGLGRLAACYLDSLATLRVPAIGYGIRYEFGIFDQAHPGRLAGGGHRQVAALRQPVGDLPAGDQLLREVRRPHGSRIATTRGGFGSAGCRTGWSRGSPTTPRCRATAPG